MAKDKIDLIFDILTGKDELSPTLEKTTKKTTALQRGISSVGSAVKSLAGPVAIAGAAFGALALGKGFVEAASKVEDLTTQFKTLTGSTKNAQKLIKDLTEFAAKTPFQLEGLASATRQLLAFGFAQEDITDKLSKIGDVAAASGSDLQEISLIYGQVAAAGKLTGERLLQLQERAIPIGPAIAKTMGVAEKSVRDLVSKGKVDLATFEKAFASLSEEGGQFAGGMIEQSKTLSGVLSTLKDNLFLVSVQLGQELLPAIKAVSRSVIDLTRGFSRFLVGTLGTQQQKKIQQLNLRIENLTGGIKRIKGEIDEIKGGDRGLFGNLFGRNLEQANRDLNKLEETLAEVTKERDVLLKIDGKTEPIDRKISDLKNEIQKPIEKEIKTTITPIIEEGVFTPMFDNLKINFLDAAGVLVDGITSGAAGVSKIVSTAAGVVADAFFKGSGPIVKQIVEFLGKGPEEVQKTIREFNKQIPVFISNFVQAIPEAIISGLEYGIESFADTIANLGPLMEKFVQRFVDGVPRIVDSLIKNLPKIVDGLIKSLPRLITAYINAIPTIVNAFIAYFSENADVIVESFIKALIDSVPAVIEAMIKAVGDFATGGIFGGGGGGSGLIGTITDPIGAIGGLFSKGGVIPPGFPNDSFVAGVTSGERVLTPKQNEMFEKFVMGGGTGTSDETNGILAQILGAVRQGQQVEAVIQIGQEELSKVILNLNRSNQRLA